MENNDENSEEILKKLKSAFDQGSEKKRNIFISFQKEEEALRIAKDAKTSVKNLANKLKPIFAEHGQSIEIVESAIDDTKNENFIEVLYYPESRFKKARGVNTAALRFEFDSRHGKLNVFKRESVFPIPLTPVMSVSLDESAIKTVTDTTIAFATDIASK